jgi:CubicO group peptidase (beta-lactamase class C family)
VTDTSGIRGVEVLAWLPSPWPTGPNEDLSEFLLTQLSRRRSVNVTPGSQYQESEAGYDVLAGILERATAQSFRAFTDANIFKPLGMTHTSVHDDPIAIVPGHAAGFVAASAQVFFVTDFTAGGIGGNRDRLDGPGPAALVAEFRERARWFARADRHVCRL